MKQSKYSIPDYWIKRFQRKTNCWHGLFENKPLSRESIIVAPNILNSYIDQDEKGWVIYPNIQSVLGFLSYLYLPTVKKSLIKRDAESRYYYSFELDAELEEDKFLYPSKQHQIIRLQNFYGRVQQLWDKGQEQCIEELKILLKEFNENWEEERHIGHSFEIFRSPREVAEYLIEAYEQDLSIEMLENDLEMTKDEFLQLTSDEIYENEFLKRKFGDILFNRLTMTL